MTERERIALLDFCTQKFQAEHCFVGRARIPEPPIRRVPLIKAKRAWAGIGFSGFKEMYPVEDGEHFCWLSHLTGQRSDGQMFNVIISLPIDFEPEGDRADYVMKRLDNAMRKLDTFKDCSCGIIGHEITEEKDEDGDYIFRPIYSPCEIHPAVTEPES